MNTEVPIMPNPKVVLITGASSGIGEATAIRLKITGYTVYGGARRIERMKGLEEQGIHILKLDVTDDASMVECVERIMAEQGRIDILINNAGYGSFGAFEDVPLSEAKSQFEVNVFGLARLTQLVLPSMRTNGYGKIINISSMGGKIYEPMGSWYHASKFAVEGLSDCLRLEVKGFGIDVIIIEPGGIKTEWEEITADHLLKASGNGAYKKLAEMSSKLLETSAKQGSPPEVIAKTIVGAINARRPKTRYTAGAGAGIILFLRRILPDKAFDWLIMALLHRVNRMP